MDLSGLLKTAQKNACSSSIQKRCSLDVGPPKKLPKTKVDPNAIRALLERKEKERREERETLISKAVASTKRDDVHYKDTKGRRKQEQQWSEKCKQQWLKIQRERRDFIKQMHRAADERDAHKKVRDREEVISSVKRKEEDKERKPRKRKYEIFEGSTDTTRKSKVRLSAPPSGSSVKISSIDELMKIAQSNAKSGSFGADCRLTVEPPAAKKTALEDEPRLMTLAEKRRIAEEEAIARKAEIRVPKIPKVGTNPNGTGKPQPNGIGRIPKKGEACTSNGSSSSNGHRDGRPSSSSSVPSKSSSRSEHSRSSGEREGSRRDRPASSKDHKSRDRSEKEHSKGHRDQKESRDRSRAEVSKDSKDRTPKAVRPVENGSSVQKSTSASKDRSAPALEQPQRKAPTLAVSTNANGKPSVGSLPAADRDRLRAEMARKLEQLRKERLETEEEERRKKMLARKAHQAEEAALKKRLRELQTRGPIDSEEDEDDYEEDLDAYEDDFIDDGEIDDPYAKRYSKDIAKIFKYDKRKYAHLDDEDIEESSFSRCMAEEARSARLGRQEDLEDMRREEEELRAKDMKARKLEELSKKLKQKKKLTLCPV